MTTRVLIVEDELGAQELFRQNFRREIRKGIDNFGFARAGEQALEVLKNGARPKILMVLSNIGPFYSP